MGYSNILTACRSRATRQIFAVAVPVALMALLYQRGAAIDVSSVMALFHTFSAKSWVLGAVFTLISLAAVGFYDVLAARHLRLDIPDRQAFAAGWRATALAQAVGFGLFSGSLARWKLHARQPEFSLWQATQMTGVVTACFFGGWAIVASGAALLAPQIPPQFWWLALLGAWLAICVAVLSFKATPESGRALPPVRLIARVTLITLVDTVASCLVVYVFLPEGSTPFLNLYACFLLAYCAGMVSGIPAGVGPFELSFLALMPGVEPSALLAALLAYRVIYFAGPAIVALIPPKRRPSMTRAAPLQRAPMTGTPPPELSLLTQGKLRLIAGPHGRTQSLGCQTCNTEILLRDPFGGEPATFLRARLQRAARTFRGLLVYKAGAGTARAARAIGLSVHQIGSEAVLSPARFDLKTPARAKLRRKLRSCAKKGVYVTPNAPQIADLERIDREWQRRNGPARGFSMGQLSRDLIRTQRIFTAYLEEQPVAFVTFHQTADTWVLDLVRSGHSCPDGAMHALICAALDAARAQGVVTLSLCSAPMHLGAPPRTWVEHLISALWHCSKAPRGLYQFKSCFDPEWVPQFIVADSLFTLISGGLELARLIRRPQRPQADTGEAAHDDYDDYQFDSYAFACEEAR